jgi:hypothetical protein
VPRLRVVSAPRLYHPQRAWRSWAVRLYADRPPPRGWVLARREAQLCVLAGLLDLLLIVPEADQNRAVQVAVDAYLDAHRAAGGSTA